MSRNAHTFFEPELHLGETSEMLLEKNQLVSAENILFELFARIKIFPFAYNVLEFVTCVAFS